MKEQLISFETAKLAKEKLFDWNCFYKFVNNSDVEVNNEINSFNWNAFSNKVSAPTQSLLQKWLRDKCDIRVYVYEHTDEHGVTMYGSNIYGNRYEVISPYKPSYENALEAGLKEALK